MKKQLQPSKDAQKEPECPSPVKEPPTEAPLKEQTKSAENEENNGTLRNAGVVDDTDFSPLLEEMPLNEVNAHLQIPESIEITSLNEIKKTLFKSPDTMSTMTGDAYITCPVHDPRGDKKEAVALTGSLLSETGALRCRLDITLDHLPMSVEGKPKCALHRWAGFRTKGLLLFCPQCNVNLCIGCYGVFHRTRNIASMRAYFAESMERDGDSVDSSRISDNSNKKRRRLTY